MLGLMVAGMAVLLATIAVIGWAMVRGPTAATSPPAPLASQSLQPIATMPAPEATIEVNGSTLTAVGRASAVTEAGALVAAERAAKAAYIRSFADQLRAVDAVSPGLDRFPLPADDEELVSLFERHVVLLPTMTVREQSATASPEGWTAVSHVEVDGREAALAPYTTTSEFKGLTVAAAPPWTEPGGRLVARRSWFAAFPLGLRVQRIGRRGLTSPERFAEVAEAQFQALPSEERLEIVFTDGHREYVAPFQRRATPQ